MCSGGVFFFSSNQRLPDRPHRRLTGEEQTRGYMQIRLKLCPTMYKLSQIFMHEAQRDRMCTRTHSKWNRGVPGPSTAAGGIPFRPAALLALRPTPHLTSPSTQTTARPSWLQPPPCPQTTPKYKVTENTWPWFITDTTVSLKIAKKAPSGGGCHRWPDTGFYTHRWI